MPLMRLFESEEQARESAAQVEAAGYHPGLIFVVAPSSSAAPAEDGGDAPAVATAPSPEELIELLNPNGKLGKSQAITLSRDVESGKTLVAVGEPLGYLYRAEKILAAAGGEEAHISSSYYSGEGGMLFSKFPFGFPLLANGLMMSGKDPLTKPGWTVFNIKISSGTFLSGKLGFKELSDKGPFLSDKLGFKELSHKRILYKRNSDT